MTHHNHAELADAIDAVKTGKRLTRAQRYTLAFAAENWLRLEWKPGTTPPTANIHLGESFERLFYAGGKWERLGSFGLEYTDTPRFYLEAHLLPAVPK